MPGMDVAGSLALPATVSCHRPHSAGAVSTPSDDVVEVRLSRSCDARQNVR